MFRELLAPRAARGHKGTFGHVLVVAGSRGKTGAAAMSGLAALRAGAGLVTVASADSAIPEIAVARAGADDRAAARNRIRQHRAQCRPASAGEGQDRDRHGAGPGPRAEIAELVHALAETFAQPMVLDADALVGMVAAARAARARSDAASRRNGAPDGQDHRRSAGGPRRRRARVRHGARRHAGAQRASAP